MNDKEMTKEEAARILLAYAQVNVETGGARDAIAFLIGARCLLRAGIHKRRNHASRARRGLKPFCQDSAKTAPDCQGLATDEPTQPTT